MNYLLLTPFLYGADIMHIIKSYISPFPKDVVVYFTKYSFESPLIQGLSKKLLGKIII